MRFWKWLAGHWMYSLAVVLSFTVIVLVMIGWVTVDTAMALVFAIVALLMADFRPQLERHQKQVLAALTEIAAAGKAAQAHNLPQALAAGEAAVADGAQVAEEVKAEKS